MRLSAYLMLVAAAGMIPGLLAAVVAVDKVREGERQAALRGLRETVRATALLVDREIQGSLGTLAALGNSEHLKTGDLRAFYDQAAAVDRPPHVWTLLLDETGSQLLNTITPFGAPAPPPAARERVAQVLTTQRPLVSDLIVGPVTGKLLNTVYVPARANKGYVVAQVLSVDTWNLNAALPKVQTSWILAILDHEGRFIARSKLADKLIGKPARPELVAAAAASADGLIRHKTLEGIDVYDAFTHSELSGWTIAVAAPVNTIEASAWLAVGWLMAGLATALASGTAMATVLGRKFLRGIGVACAGAIALGRGEQPVVRATALQEVDALNHALADAGRLLSSERLSREAAQQERARLLAGAIAAREAAQRENTAKDQFLAMLGHELRNPLAGIAGAITLLQRKRGDAAASDRYLGIIERQGGHLNRIVDDLLDVSRIASGKIELQLALFDLADGVTKAVDALRVTAQAAGHALIVTTEPAWVRADAARIDQIVNNLVANALKFSAPGGEVRLRVSVVAVHAVFEVIDSGAGIDPELMPRIFDPFVQGPGPAGRLQSGLGVGLALVKQLVSLHGGDVSARSDGAGKGSSFVVRLPRAEPPGDLGATDRLADAPDLTASADRHGAVALPTTENARVLLVEDNPDARATLLQMLRDMGYAVDTAADGEQALAQAVRCLPELVIMDIGLPGRDGYAVTAQMRQMPECRDTRFVALSGYGEAGQRRYTANSVFDDHVVKPAQPEVLARTIEAQLRQLRQGRSNPSN